MQISVHWQAERSTSHFFCNNKIYILLTKKQRNNFQTKFGISRSIKSEHNQDEHLRTIFLIKITFLLIFKLCDEEHCNQISTQTSYCSTKSSFNFENVLYETLEWQTLNKSDNLINAAARDLQTKSEEVTVVKWSSKFAKFHMQNQNSLNGFHLWFACKKGIWQFHKVLPMHLMKTIKRNGGQLSDIIIKANTTSLLN